MWGAGQTSLKFHIGQLCHAEAGSVRVLDVGCGANLIYPLLGAAMHGWRFVGVDITDTAVEWAAKNAAANPDLQHLLEIRRVPHPPGSDAGTGCASMHCLHGKHCQPPSNCSSNPSELCATRLQRTTWVCSMTSHPWSSTPCAAGSPPHRERSPEQCLTLGPRATSHISFSQICVLHVQGQAWLARAGITSERSHTQPTVFARCSRHVSDVAKSRAQPNA